VFYFGQRQWIFDVPIEDDLDELIRMTIRHFMAGARAVLPAMLGTNPALKTAARRTNKGKH
jgi:hypothetical protein